MFNSRKHRRLPDAPTGSMADIAFLLLIFFFLTTTILNESGLLVRLPPWVETPAPFVPYADRNTLTIKVNGANQLLVEKEPMNLSDLRDFATNFILNPEGVKTLAISPANAVVSLHHDRNTEYDTYLQVYNELLAAYRECRDLEAHKRFGKSFEDLSLVQQRTIKKDIPMVISEAEPSQYDLTAIE
ncbi:MAG: biopolymer transporter ExbD [Saprospiraceae bacterium]|nr:biopolymer transporter ExbD [Saprospiraceae bacterium]